MMVHRESATVKAPTSQNKLISDSGNNAEHEASGHASRQLAGDHGLEATDAATPDLRTEDLDRPSKSEGHQTPVELAGDETSTQKTSSPAKKKVMSSPGNANRTTPTTTVKKVLKSGTFGVGSVKPTGAKVPVTTTATKPSALALKRSTTSPPSAKITSHSPAAPKPAATGSRRASVVPAKTTSPALSKQSLSASATTKPSTGDATLRASPTGSIGSAKSPAPTPVPTKSRASVSGEAAKKPPLRLSVATSAKPAGPPKVTTVSRSFAASPAKASRPMGSISSIKEVKEGSSKERKDNDNAINDVKAQLDEANKLLESKMAAVADLEAKIVQLEESLVSANVDIDAKANSAAEFQKALLSAEARLAETRETLNTVQEVLVGVESSRESLEKELDATKSTVSAKEEAEQSLQSQLGDLQKSVATYGEQISELEKNHAAAMTSIEEAAAVEREALRKSRAGFKAISEEMEALKISHAQTVEAQISKLEDMVATEGTLKTQLTALKAEKEETANKISELEVEILELKDAQENLEDTQSSLQKRVKELEQDLADAKTAVTLADDNAKVKAADFTKKLEGISAEHEKALGDGAVQLILVTNELKKLQAEHTEALADHEQTKQKLVDQGTKHLAEVKDLEKVHADALASLSSQLEQVSRELNEQEAIYHSKVDEVKAEHTKLLEEAFELAKNEAAHVHTQELQTLRSDSDRAFEQLTEANRVSLEELKAEHTSQLESEVNGLNKQIHTLNIELKATQDDLAKAKASLEIARGEAESLAMQRDEARAQAEAVPPINPEQAEEIARLTGELSRTKDDLEVMTDMVNLTKSSMTELSDKQAKELEAAAKGRADEALLLRAAHDEKVSQLATQKSESQVRISDLEGELATVKAALAAQEAALPKVNGTGVSHPPSSPGVTKDELQQLHEAHNLKIHDIQAEHDKEMSSAKGELEAALGKVAELQDDMSRKTMEIQYLEQEQEEQQEQITRLKEDVENFSEKLAQQST